MTTYKTMTAFEASKYCKENNVSPERWSCGYILEVDLELKHNIKLEHEDSWQDLEDYLHYND